MQKVIVTGSAGFVGCNAVHSLLNSGYFVYAIVRPNSKHNTRIIESERLRKIEIDMNDILSLPEYIQENCDAFLHLAWQGAHNDFKSQEENIKYSIDSIEVAATLSCKRFLCTGSQAEYGLQDDLITEECLTKPINAYGAAKVATCHLTKIRAQQLNMEWIWGRIFSVYGKYEPGTTLVSYLLSTLKNNQPPNLTSATQNWDYLYSADAGNAIVALLEKGKNGEVYNIANGEFRPLKYFTEMVKNYINPDVEINYGKFNENLVSLQPSVEKIQKDTGWHAKTSFLEGVKYLSIR